MPQQKKVGDFTFHVGDKVMYDSPHAWREGEITEIGSTTVKIRITGTSVLQVVKFPDLRPIQVKVYNNTKLTQAEIEARTLVGIIKNNWRQRMVKLYTSEDPTKLYMVGTAFDGSTIVLSEEGIGMNEGIAMDYWQNGQKTLIRD